MSSTRLQLIFIQFATSGLISGLMGFSSYFEGQSSYLPVEKAFLTKFQGPHPIPSEVHHFSPKTPGSDSFWLQQASFRSLDDDNATETGESGHGCGFCKTDLKLNQTGEISSANFPEPYPADQNCLWLLQTRDPSHRITLTCDTVHLEHCGPLGRDSPTWKDYLVVSPLWTFKKSWVYCGHATTMTALTHQSLCDKMAVAFRSNANPNDNQGFRCTFQVIA